MSADAGQAVTEVAGGPSNAARPTVSASSPLSSPTKPDTTLSAPSALSLSTAPTDSAQPATASADAAGAAAPAQAGPSSTQSATAEGPAPPPKYLQPSEFYPLNNHPTSTVPPTYPGGHLSPEDDRFAARGIPIFRPTLEEFIDFEAYVTRTVPWGQYSGIVKIIPPAEWTDSLPAIPKSAIADVRIKSPIQQNMLGQAGLFRQTNVEKNKSRPLSVKEWYNKSRDKRWAAPGPKDVDVTLDRDSAEARMKRQREVEKIKGAKMAARVKRKEAADRKLLRQRAQAALKDTTEKEPDQDKEQEQAEDVEMEAADEGVPDAVGGSKERIAGNGDGAGTADTALDADDVPPLDPSNHHSPHSSSSDSAKTPDSASPPLEPFYQDFDPSTAWLPEGTSPSDYTPEACSAMERKFWKTMGLGEPSWYGADLQGTLFPDPKTPWNVAHLPNLLNRLGRELPGVNRPYLYFGMWRAAFAWHVEDMDLFSINYIHFGAPKFWYAIPQLQAEHFERTIQGYFPREAKQCDQFLRHKSYIMSPNRLAKDGIHVNMLVHNQGEFVITYPRGYHAGFNMGFNCAESVNFALDSWVELGRRAKVCHCVSHSVRIDVDELLGENERAAQEKRMKTEQDLIAAIEAERSGRKKRPAANASERPRKRVKKEAEAEGAVAVALAEEDPMAESAEPAALPEVPSIPVREMEKKRKTIPLVPPKERKTKVVMPKQPSFFPCVLCPDMSTADLFEVYQPGDAVKNMCKSEDGVVRAHGDCATSVPEVWIGEEEGKDWAMGINEISKARWALKCQICTDKKLAAYGAKVQCVSGKCPRAFHVSCARDDEAAVHRIWEVEEYEPVPIPDDAPEGTQHEFIKAKHLKVETLCPTHNPEFKELKKRQAAEALKAKVLAIIPGQNVKIKSSRGMFEVTLVRLFENEQKAEVRHENGLSSMVKWNEFDFRPAVVHKPIENEYARVHTHTRRPDGTVVPIEPAQHSASVTSSPAPATVRKPAKSPKQPKPPRAKPTLSQPLSVKQMLNPSPAVPQHDPRHIPSRVVVCDSDYRQQPQGYGPPPPSFLSQGPPALYAPPNGYASMPPHGHAYPVQGHPGYAGPSYPAPMHYAQPGPYAYAAAPSPGYGQPSYPAYNAPPLSNGHAQYQHPRYPAPPQPVSMPYPHALNSAPYVPVAPSYPHSRPQVQGWSPVGNGPHGVPLPPVSADIRRSSSSSSVNNLIHPPPPGVRAYSASPSVLAPQVMPMAHVPQTNGYSSTSVEQGARRASSSSSSARQAQVQAPPLFTSQRSSSSPSKVRSDPNGAGAHAGAGVGKIDLGLERMKRLMQLLSRIQTPAVHLAGTNGKGSVSAMLESVFRLSGLRVARYNSPHLIEPRDAIALDGSAPSAGDYQVTMAKVQHLARSNGIEATTFEIATAAAFDLINAYQPDVMIIECGMGGIGDATNVIPPELVLASGLTSVGLDHTAFLGNDLEEITEKKAGIAVRNGVLVVGSQMYNGVARVARRVAEANGARVVFAEAAQYVRSGNKVAPVLDLALDEPKLPVRTIRVQTAAGKLVECDLGLAGEHQLDNASLAINLVTTILSDPRAMEIQPKVALVSDQSIKRGIAATRWKGRCELLSFPTDGGHVPVLVDGAHNFDSASTLRRYIDSLDIKPTKKLTWILGLSDSKGKTPESVVQPLLRPGDRVICTEFADVEGMPWVKPVRPDTVARIAGGCKASRVDSVKDVRAGMALVARERREMNQGEKGLVIIAGSLYLVADFYRLLGI